MCRSLFPHLPQFRRDFQSPGAEPGAPPRPAMGLQPRAAKGRGQPNGADQAMQESARGQSPAAMLSELEAGSEEGLIPGLGAGPPAHSRCAAAVAPSGVGWRPWHPETWRPAFRDPAA